MLVEEMEIHDHARTDVLPALPATGEGRLESQGETTAVQKCIDTKEAFPWT